MLKRRCSCFAVLALITISGWSIPVRADVTTVIPAPKQCRVQGDPMPLAPFKHLFPTEVPEGLKMSPGPAQ